MESVWLIGFTGHRIADSPGRSEEEIRACRPALKSTLERLREQAQAQSGRIELITGLADGADLEAAEVSLELGIPLHLILPMSETLFFGDFDPADDSLLRAKHIFESVRTGKVTGSWRVSSGTYDRPACYYEAGIQMLDATDLLVSIWTGEKEKGMGGTADVIAQAKRVGIPVVTINPLSVDKIDDGSVENWPSPDKIMEQIRDVLEETDARSSTSSSQRSSEEIFIALDDAANQTSGRFRSRLKRSIILHFLAAMIAATAAVVWPVFNGPEAPKWREIIPTGFAAVQLVILVYAYWLIWKAGRAALDTQWRQARFGAEVLRSIHLTTSFLDPLFPIIVRHAPEWRRFAVSMRLSLQVETETADFEKQKSDYLKDRIEYQRDAYFQKELTSAQHQARFLRRVARIASWTAPCLISIALIVRIKDPTWPADHWYGALFAAWFPIVLPLAAGVATSLNFTLDTARRAERFRFMSEQLHEVALSLPGLKTRNTVRKAVARVEDVMLDELIEWHAASRSPVK